VVTTQAAQIVAQGGGNDNNYCAKTDSAEKSLRLGGRASLYFIQIVGKGSSCP